MSEMGEPFSKERMKWIVGLAIPGTAFGGLIILLMLGGSWWIVWCAWRYFDATFTHLFLWWVFCAAIYGVSGARSRSTKDWL
mgnify:CR=1 FL=1